MTKLIEANTWRNPVPEKVFAIAKVASNIPKAYSSALIPPSPFVIATGREKSLSRRSTAVGEVGEVENRTDSIWGRTPVSAPHWECKVAPLQAHMSTRCTRI